MSRTGAIDRREAIAGVLAAAVGAASAPPPAFAATGSPAQIYIGGFTTPQRDGRGAGIELYEVGSPRGWVLKQTVRTSNASFLLADNRRKLLFCANADERYLTAFRMDPASGALTELGAAQTGGLNSLYLTFDPSRRFVISANYGSGNISVFAIDDSRGFGERTDVFQLTGTPGPHRVQQNASEPHQVLYDPTGRFIIVPDKGVDRIHVLKLDGATGRLSLTSERAVRSGTGPRHAVFHPGKPILYVLSELGSTVTAYALDDTGALTPLQIISTLPDNFFGDSIASEICIEPTTRTLYVSNRGHDSVASFRIGSTGRMSAAAWTPTGGGNPRFITLAPDRARLLVLNQDSDTIVSFAVARDGGLRGGATVARSGSPACLIFRGSD